MGKRGAGKRPWRLRVLPLIAASLVMLLATVSVLAAQYPDQVTQYSAPVDQQEPGPPGDASGVCDHAPGEFLVGYASEAALQAASPESVVETLPLSSPSISPSRR